MPLPNQFIVEQASFGSLGGGHHSTRARERERERERERQKKPQANSSLIRGFLQPSKMVAKFKKMTNKKLSAKNGIEGEIY